MISSWVQDQVRAFGQQLELSSFALNDRGMVAVLFENGVKLRLEYREPDLWVQVLLALPPNDDAVARLLAEAHPRRAVTPQGVVRAAYLERAGEAMLTIALPADRIESTEIDAAFRELFDRAVRLGRSL